MTNNSPDSLRHEAAFKYTLCDLFVTVIDDHSDIGLDGQHSQHGHHDHSDFGQFVNIVVLLLRLPLCPRQIIAPVPAVEDEKQERKEGSGKNVDLFRLKVDSVNMDNVSR